MTTFFSSIPIGSRRLRLLLAGGGMLAAGLIAFSFIELRESRADLLQSSKLEAETLIEAINRGNESAIASGAEIENMLLERLRASAALIAHLEEHTRPGDATLRALADELSLDYIALTDGTGRVAVASIGAHGGKALSADLADVLAQPLGDSLRAWLPGTLAPVSDSALFYLLAVPRRRVRGQVLVGVDADAMLSFRKKVGIGKLLRDIADNPDISFVTLQDMDGILAASTSVTSMVAIEDDPFLAEAWHADSSRTRVIDSGDAPLLEVVRSLRLEDGSHVLTRVGLRLDNVRRIQQRGLQRLAIIAAAMFAGGIALLLLMTTRKRFSALREEHALVKSEQERIAAQLERRDRLTAMGALASGIAHEIRNPLNAISMIVQRFRTEFQPAEDVEEYRQLADTMRSEVQRVNGIVTQFLEFARPPKLDLQPARLADIVRRAADVVDSEARHAGITVALDLQESPAPCLIDVPRMQQALLNLFQNALQSMRSGGTLAVSLRVTHRACILTVRDSGCGIPRETLPNIFNLYFTTKQGGSGLGLSVVHQIIAEHRGEIAVESTVGTGTTFTITLPGS